MLALPEGVPQPAVRRLFDAERLVRAKKRVDAGSLGLDPYWADLVRLLQIHFAQGDDTRLDVIKAELAHASYRTFVDLRRGRKPLKRVESAQGILPL